MDGGRSAGWLGSRNLREPCGRLFVRVTVCVLLGQLMSVCAVCGSSDFGDPQDGLFFCLECGTQSQDVRVEVSQVEDGGGFTRTLKKKKEKSKKEGTQCVDSDHHALETFQRILKRQCDALIDLGFDPTVKEAARLIWFTYLRHYGYAFRDQPQNTQLPRHSGSGKQDMATGHSRPDDSSTNTLNDASTPHRSPCRPCSETKVVSLRGRRGTKRPRGDLAPNAKQAKTKNDREKNASGFYDFPDDEFLFEEANSQEENVGSGKEAVKMDASESVRIMESISSWQELDELERTMDCKQLLKFRHAYLSSQSPKPKFVGKGEHWANLPRVFKQYMTVSVLYLALLYTEQPVLPVDIVRWVRLEKIPLNTPLEKKGARFRNPDNVEVFFTTTLVTTAGVVEQAFRLYQHLPLPTIPSPDPHAISHIIVNRLHLTECFKGLVDKALDSVYLPIGFTRRCRMDCECAAVIVMMLRILYGLDDHTEMDSSLYSDEPVRPAQGGPHVPESSPSSSHSLPVWVDWVQFYCTHLSKSPEDVPFNNQELSKVKNFQRYFQFCRETVFTKCRPVPIRSKSYREIDPAFSKRITKIFSSFLCSSSHKSTTDPPTTSSPSLPPSLPPPSPSDSPEFPQLVPLTHFIRNPKAPCTTYRPLPPLYHIQQDVDEGQLSHAMRFVLSVMCQLIDVQLRTMYTTLLTVEKAFTKGIVVILKNLTYDFLNS